MVAHLSGLNGVYKWIYCKNMTILKIWCLCFV